MAIERDKFLYVYTDTAEDARKFFGLPPESPVRAAHDHGGLRWAAKAADVKAAEEAAKAEPPQPGDNIAQAIEEERLGEGQTFSERSVIMAETKTFPLRVLLTVTTGRLLTKSSGDRDNGISDLHEILGWMTNDSPFTHQLPRFNDECKPWLLRWFPELAQVKVEALDELVTLHDPERGVEGWLQAVEASTDCKAEYAVPRIPQDDHERKHPYDELVAMRGTDEGIVVIDEHGKVH